jgi:Peptidase A4 family
MKNIAFSLCLSTAALSLLVVSTTASAAPGRAVQLPVRTDTNSHWAGYVAVGDKPGYFTEVLAEWHVPLGARGGLIPEKAVDWVGIDGWGNNHIIQIGTEVAYKYRSGLQYFAWYEVAVNKEDSKKALQLVPDKDLVIHPGDLMEGAVQELSPNKWVLYIADLVTGRHWSEEVPFQTPGTSAEAIHENPATGSRLRYLANTTSVEFISLALNHEPVNFVPGYFQGVTLYQVSMVADGDHLATPSQLTGACFTVADGGTEPAPPSSCPL